jgi:hypothetical protein
MTKITLLYCNGQATEAQLNPIVVTPENDAKHGTEGKRLQAESFDL